ncbi:MAG: hypothetical protein GEV28_12125 [Actinophytocola sp.]|uniref:hypothetical protein n=1 Tax=Actinophytocola sp. TaxID=1872138 RepID=UPI0013265278|nr:hypothetical protein [Actinophytocola sp.]MPZ81089.1 hypothetical protein [Actinophytocola sp.]
MTATQAARRELGVLTGSLFVVLWLAGTFVPSASDVAFPRPTDDMETVRASVEASSSTLEKGAALQILAGIALLWFAATLAGYLRRRGASPELVLAGGVTAAVTLLFSAAGNVAMGTDLATDAVSAQLLYQLSFWTGGPIHVAALGTMIVAGALGSGLPRWVTVPGIVIGGLGVLASFSALVSPMTILTPIGRFLGFLWILVATIMIATRRPATVSTEDSAQI